MLNECCVKAVSRTTSCGKGLLILELKVGQRKSGITRLT